MHPGGLRRFELERERVAAIDNTGDLDRLARRRPRLRDLGDIDEEDGGPRRDPEPLCVVRAALARRNADLRVIELDAELELGAAAETRAPDRGPFERRQRTGADEGIGNRRR